jgi:hypothetical protein
MTIWCLGYERSWCRETITPENGNPPQSLWRTPAGDACTHPSPQYIWGNWGSASAVAVQISNDLLEYLSSFQKYFLVRLSVSTASPAIGWWIVTSEQQIAVLPESRGVGKEPFWMHVVLNLRMGFLMKIKHPKRYNSIWHSEASTRHKKAYR